MNFVQLEIGSAPAIRKVGVDQVYEELRWVCV